MSRKIAFPLLLVVILAASACSGVVPGTPSPVPTGTVAPPTPTAPGATATSVATLAPAPSDTPLPSDTLVPLVPVSVPASPNYIDDRSTPSQVIVSFYNAIGRQEYSRAYGYYGTPDTTLGPFATFAGGYSATASVDLVFGPIIGDPGMSQVYYTIPVILKVTSRSNVRSNFAACYVVHETNPDVYGAPPISPMNINSGSAVASDLNAGDASVLATACSGNPGIGNPPLSASANGLSIDKSNFVDNRSGPLETVSSLLNALNLKQYVRAYSYFQVPGTFPGSYDPWAAGYADTDTITATFGTIQSEGAAGSLYYKVPLGMVVLTASSATQTFVGCYTLHLAQPANQAVPPFQPLGIVSGSFKQVTNGTDLNPLLVTSCN